MQRQLVKVETQEKAERLLNPVMESTRISANNLNKVKDNFWLKGWKLIGFPQRRNLPSAFIFLIERALFI